jgi:hypothetical protein
MWFTHALAAVAAPRLPAANGGEEVNPTTACRSIQVEFNNVARSITGGKLRNRVSTPTLLDLAKIPSVNAMVVKAVALKAWSCNHSTDGRDGTRNHVGAIVFDENKSETSKKMRAAKFGLVTIPLRGVGDTFVAHAATVWNTSEDLRAAKKKTVAKRAAVHLARQSPL